MKKKILKLTVIMTAATGIIVSGASDNRAAYAMEETTGKYDANADSYFQSDMDLYYQYVENHELKDFLDGSMGIFGDVRTYDDTYVTNVKVADFDGDNRAEVWVTGPVASANRIAGILDISDGEAKCVFNGWGSEAGRYTDPVTGKTGIVISEGNTDGDVHLRKCIYDENWNGTVLYETKGSVDDNTVVYTAYTNNEERQLTMEEYGEETYNLYNNCTVTEAVAETPADVETTHLDKQGLLDFLQSLKSAKVSGVGENDQNSAITGYPEYDEIIRQYYTGMISNWSMGEFSEKNLCYLAGSEMGGADNLGYYLTDIDGDGIEELMIGATGENAYTGMFYDLYTIVNDQRALVVSSGERDRYYLCVDGTVANEGSGGASNSVYNYYNLVSGQLEFKEGVFLDAYSHPENPWFYTTTSTVEDYSNPISEEEGRNVIGKYVYMDIPYIPLKEINLEEGGETEDAETTYSEPQTEQISPAQQVSSQIEETEQQVSAIEAEIGENVNMSDEEYKQKLNQLYEIWDKVLNDEWAVLKNTLSSEEMDVLTQEEIEWINNKESTVNSIRNESETDSLIKATELTRERVYVLLDKLRD